MKVKALELRDRATFIPIVAVDMNPDTDINARDGRKQDPGQRYLLRRCGYPCNGEPNILITSMHADGSPAWNDPYGWSGRTFPVAHNWIIDHWTELKDGDVVDVEFILGERKTAKLSERVDVTGDDSEDREAKAEEYTGPRLQDHNEG